MPCGWRSRGSASRRSNGERGGSGRSSSEAWARRWARTAAVCCALLPQLAGAVVTCKTEQNMEYVGANVAITFGASGLQGCKVTGDATACCWLCAQNFPLCTSWQYIKNGNVNNGWNGYNNYCCLKDASLGFRPNPQTSDCCDSGYQNPTCIIGSPCNVEIDGSALSATDSLLAVAIPGECGYNESASWSGIDNPKSVTATAPYNAYAFGEALTGIVGDFRLCYKSSAGSIDSYSQILGTFTMRGPSPDQVLTCTLGAECLVIIDGNGFSADPARYFLAIVDGDCPSGGTFSGTLASFGGLFNPDNVEDNAADNQFRMGTPFNGDTSKTYTVCWADNPSSITDYSIRVGTFLMGGPSANQISCTMGTSCTVTLAGNLFGSTNAIIIGVTAQTLCGFYGTQAWFSYEGTFNNPKTVTNTAPHGTYDMGLAQVAHFNVGPGKVYRICWAQSPTQFPSLMDFRNYRINAGDFTLVGPTIHQGVALEACKFTRQCTWELTGFGLNDPDIIEFWGIVIAMPGSKCGDSDIELPNITGTVSDPWVNPSRGNDTWRINFGTPTIGLATLTGANADNVYVACWGPRPTQLSDYTVTLGTFTLGGPVIQSTTVECTKGLTCDITIVGSLLSGTNKILVIGSGECTSHGAKADFAPMNVEKTPNQDGTFTTYQFGLPNTGTARDGYTMCWGYGPQTQSEISYFMGTFTMNGPNYVDKTCTLSKSCTITLQGHGLAATNRLLVLFSGNCGDNGPGFAFFTGFTYNKQVEQNSPYATYVLGTPMNGVPGTTYKLCWAHDAIGLGIGNIAYRVPVGGFTVEGPIQTAQMCTMSTQCNLQLAGTNLATTNKVLIVSGATCGASSPATASFSGLTNPTQAESSDAGAYKLGIPAAGTPGNAYSICWAHNPAVDADYNVKLGTFSINGPNVVVLAECTMGLPCVVTITGFGLAATNKIIVTALSDTCGSTGLNDAKMAGLTNPAPIGATLQNFPMGTITRGVPGDYTVCWAHNPSGEPDYWVRAATFRLAGPYESFNQCTMSVPCHISLTGVNLAHLSKVLIIPRTSTCGDTITPLPTWTGLINPAGTNTLPPPAVGPFTFANADTYNGGLAIAGEPGYDYTLCWAFAPAGGLGTTEYKVPVGSFSVNGPKQGIALACTLGQPCNVVLEGWGLQSFNKVLIAAGTAPCGDPALESAVMQGITNPKLVTDDAYDNSFAMGAVMVGGSYGVCRVGSPAASCIGSHYRLCWSQGEQFPGGGEPLYSVFLGTFSMSGPYVTYATECLMGAVCAFRIYGATFVLSNRVMLIDQTGQCGDAEPRIAMFNGLTNPQKVSEVNADGTDETYRLGRALGGTIGDYRLCWGVDPVVPLHYNIEVGTFSLKALPGHCSIDDGLTVTCGAVSS